MVPVRTKFNVSGRMNHRKELKLAVVTAKNIFDDRFCSFIVDLLLGGGWIEYFVIVVELSLHESKRFGD